MPATAAHQPDSDGEPCLAPVVDLSSRRGVKVTTTTPDNDVMDTELQERAAAHWVKVFTAAGVDMAAPATLPVVRLLTKELERLVGGLLVIREGREDLPADPNAGVDFTSAVELTGVLRDLARAAEAQAARD